VCSDIVVAFDQPPRHRQNQRHRQIGSCLGQHTGRIRDRDSKFPRRRDVDVVVPTA